MLIEAGDNTRVLGYFRRKLNILLRRRTLTVVLVGVLALVIRACLSASSADTEATFPGRVQLFAGRAILLRPAA